MVRYEEEDDEKEEKRSPLRLLVNTILLVFLVGLVATLALFAYEQYGKGTQNLQIKSNNLGINIEENVTAPGEVTQFVPNMRFNHNTLSYYIDDTCPEEKRARFYKALGIIEKNTGIIIFSQVLQTENADISVSCSKATLETEKNVFVAGEGGPTKYLNLSLYPAILKGTVVLYEQSQCDYPITELHELLHVFGFSHINNRGLIMYPYVDCKQVIPEEIIRKLIQLYTIKPLAELYFINENSSFVKFQNYLNFTVGIKNEGLLDADSVSLDILNSDKDDKLIKSFNLEKIEFGSGQKFSVSYLKLPFSNEGNIKLVLKTNQEEYNKENNILEAGF